MFGRILKKDILRNKVITATLFLFILLAAVLVSSAVNIIVTLFSSMDSLFVQSRAPHYVQMHSGEIDQSSIDEFSGNNPIVESQQTVAMLGVSGAYIYLGGNEVSEAESIIENSFVVQNKSFDFLIDTESKIVQVKDGEIAVPIYHMQRYGLKIGDTVRIAANDFERTFTITAFVRDAQMNPSIITSKRFVVSENDWAYLSENIGEPEYLIEFMLIEESLVSEFEGLYQASGLPQKDTAITYSLFRMLNALTDGVAAAVIILISVLLIAVAALCLRFTLTAAIEEDYREIGVMKAIGISGGNIRKLYMIKYEAIAAIASLTGFLISLFVGGIFTANISLYMGTAPKTLVSALLPVLGSLFVFLSVVLFCRLILRRFRKISAVEGMRNGTGADNKRTAKGFRLSRSGYKNLNVYMGIKAVFSRFGMYGILCFIFIVCTFLTSVPANFLNTLKSPDFISYMGAGRSDIRIDMFTRGEDLDGRYKEISGYLQNDTDIEQYAAFVTAAYKVQNAEGLYENIKIENGNFTAFPIEYLHGAAPVLESEIALSSMNADEMQKSVGDTLNILTERGEQTLTVCGIYQDVTNGGKTAKGHLPYSSDNILWYLINAKVAEGVSVSEKIAEINNTFSSVKITDMADYASQTLGGLIEQLSLAAALGFILAAGIAALITAMFFRMLIAKDTRQIAIMRSLGLSFKDIQLQYITRAAIVLIIGIAAGSIVSAGLGQELAGMLVPGISNMRFIINPVMSFAVCPLTLGLVVGVTVFIVSSSIKNISIMLAAE